MEVFEDILKSNYELRKELADMAIRHYGGMIKYWRNINEKI